MGHASLVDLVGVVASTTVTTSTSFELASSHARVTSIKFTKQQGGITFEAIDEPGKSSKAIDKRVIINFHDKNVVIARFRNKNEVFVLFIIYILIYIQLLIYTYTFLD